jgi:hydrogenase maturation protease
MRIAVIGIGQTLRGDDAVGIEAVHCWQQSFPETARRSDVEAQSSELPGLGLLDLLDGFDAAVLVDAVQSSAAPGVIHRLDREQLSAFGSTAKSAHGWGVAETLELDRQLNPSRPELRIRLIGIEAQQMDLGQALSQAVQRALPFASRAIEDEVQALLSG